MVNYQNGKIYKIVNDELNLTYFGSTTQDLKKRLSSHYHDINTHKNITSKILFTTELKPKIYLVEEVKCDNREQLEKRERYYIENFDCVNKILPSQTRNEVEKRYRKNNLELCRKRSREHNQKNKDKLREKFTCDCGGKYTYEHKSSHIKTKKHQKFINL